MNLSKKLYIYTLSSVNRNGVLLAPRYPLGALETYIS